MSHDSSRIRIERQSRTLGTRAKRPKPTTVCEVPLANPLLKYLGVQLNSWKHGEAEFHLMITKHHLNRQGNLQGGVLATLLDVACGYSGLDPSHSVAIENSASVTLNASFVNKVSTGRLIARGNLTRTGKRLYFATGEVTCEDGQLIATAQGAFRIFRSQIISHGAD